MNRRRVPPMGGAYHPLVRGPHRVIGNLSRNSDHGYIQ